jgi:hypothetical protein
MTTHADELNEKRCLAHQIIFDLFEAKATGQIALLLMACSLAHKQLAPEDHQKWLQSKVSEL